MKPLLTREIAEGLVKVAVDAARSAGADEAEAVLMTDSSALTRFAGGQIHQNVGEENAELRVRAAVGSRVAVASSSELSRGGVRTIAERAVEMARLSAEDPHFAGLIGPPKAGYVAQTTYYESTSSSTAEERAEAVGEISDALAQETGKGYGVVTAGVSELAVANSHGVEAYQEFTDGWISVIAEREGITGYASATSRDWVQLSPREVAERALAKTVALEPRDVPAGEYTVVLEEEAVAELLSFLSLYALNGLAYAEGRSFYAGRLGEDRYPGHITLRDDPTDHRGANASFDFEGFPKAPVTLIRGGVIEGVALDHQTARRVGAPNTGHALPAPNSFGPTPLNLVLDPGGGNERGSVGAGGGDAGDGSPGEAGGFTSGAEALIRDVDRGLLVTRFHYVNAVDPHQTVLTGMTRDGTFVIEDGRVVGRALNLRWVESLDGMLQRTRRVGDSVRLISEGPGYGLRFLTGSLAPALLVDGFTVTGHS